jgi:hypothetical protein
MITVPSAFVAATVRHRDAMVRFRVDRPSREEPGPDDIEAIWPGFYATLKSPQHGYNGIDPVRLLGPQLSSV